MAKNTRESIATAFIELAKQYPERSSFTMTEIASQAGISRQAIYQTHFSKMEDIIQYIHEEANVSVLAAFDSYSPKKDGQPFEFFANKILPLIYESHEISRTLYQTKADPNWQTFLFEHYSHWIITNIKYTDKINLSKEDFSFLVSNMTVSIIQMWITKDVPTPPDEFKEIFLQLVNTSLNDYLLKHENTAS